MVRYAERGLSCAGKRARRGLAVSRSQRASVYFSCLLLHRHARAPKTNLGPTRIVLGFRRGAFFRTLGRKKCGFFVDQCNQVRRADLIWKRRRHRENSLLDQHLVSTSELILVRLSATCQKHYLSQLDNCPFSLFVGDGGAAPGSQQVSLSRRCCSFYHLYVYIVPHTRVASL